MTEEIFHPIPSYIYIYIQISLSLSLSLLLSEKYAKSSVEILLGLLDGFW